MFHTESTDIQTAQEVKEMYLKLAEALQKINEQEEKINSIKESL